MTTISRKSFLRALASGLAGLPFVAKALGKVGAFPKPLTARKIRALRVSAGLPANGWTQVVRPLGSGPPQEWMTRGKYDHASLLAESIRKAIHRRMDETVLNAMDEHQSDLAAFGHAETRITIGEENHNLNEDDEQKTIL